MSHKKDGIIQPSFNQDLASEHDTSSLLDIAAEHDDPSETNNTLSNHDLPNTLNTNDQPKKTTLLTLSDDVLFRILIHLSACDLLHLADTCRRLARLCADKQLWGRIGLRWEAAPEHSQRLLPADTRVLRIKGVTYSPGVTSLPPCILQRCPRLEELVLEGLHLDAAEVKVSMFPLSLTTLRIIRCERTSYPHYPEGSASLHCSFTASWIC